MELHKPYFLSGNILHGPTAIVHIVDLVLVPIEALPAPQAASSTATEQPSHGIAFAIQVKGGWCFFCPGASAALVHLSVVTVVHLSVVHLSPWKEA